jgi:hypothetical protein
VAGSVTQASEHLARVASRDLRTDNIRSKLECHRAEVALARGEREVAQAHLVAARGISHRDDTEAFIQRLATQLGTA